MYIDEYESVIQIEAEELSETLLFGASYFDLPPELKSWIRARAIETLWPEEAQKGSGVAA